MISIESLDKRELGSKNRWLRRDTIEICGTGDGAQNMNKEWLFTVSNNTGTRASQLNDCTAG